MSKTFKITISEWGYYPSDEELKNACTLIKMDIKTVLKGLRAIGTESDEDVRDLHDELNNLLENFTWLFSCLDRGLSFTDFDLYSWKEAYDDYTNQLYSLAGSYNDLLDIR